MRKPTLQLVEEWREMHFHFLKLSVKYGKSMVSASFVKPVLAIYTGTQTKWKSAEVYSMHWCSIEEFEALTGFSPEKKALLLEMIAVAYRDYGDKLPPQDS